jgi:hypothetical protein
MNDMSGSPGSIDTTTLKVFAGEGMNCPTQAKTRLEWATGPARPAWIGYRPVTHQ